MKERMKKFTEVSFSNGPKAKNILGAVAILVAIVALVTVNMRKTITISIDGKEETFVTYTGTVKEALQEKGIRVNIKDKVQPSLESKLLAKESIMIKRAVPVNIMVNGIQLKVETAEDNVKDMLKTEETELKENGIEFNENLDEIYPSLDSNIEDNLNVKLVKVETKDIIEKQAIAFDTVVEKDSDLDKSVKKVKSEGANGQKEITYQVVYKDGVESSREIKSSKVISEPKNKVVIEGSGTMYASRGGGNKKQIACFATAYSGASGTSSGRKPARIEGGLSTIAVDPSVIPMGSKVYIDGYGYAVAADTGSGIKGSRVDLYFNTYKESCNWGLRQVPVTVIAGPGEW